MGLRDTKRKVVRFFSRPAVGISGSVASVVGVVLAIVFFLQAQAERQLVYTVHPVRTVLAEAGRPGALTILFDGDRVEEADVVTARVALWNEGDLPIRRDHLLTPVTITIEGGRLLRAEVTNLSRPVTDFKVIADTAALRSGAAELDWTILEGADGAVVDLVYTGSRTTPIRVEGVLEGQPRISELRSRARIRTGLEQYARAKRENLLLVALSLFLLPLVTATTFLQRRIASRYGSLRLEALDIENMQSESPESRDLIRHIKRKSASEAAMGIMVKVMWVVSVLMLVVAIWQWRTASVEPPFGF